MKDFYTRKSREEGYYARSAYKLKNINKKYHIIKKGDEVLDMGCSPGGWVQACLEEGCERITGVDVENAKVKDKRFEFIKGDVFGARIEGKFDVVISDLAPKTTGDKELDHERSLELAEKALGIAQQKLKEKGNFLCKAFQGKEFEKFVGKARKEFEFVKAVKPEASKKKSREMYIVCKSFVKSSKKELVEEKQ